MPRSRLLGSALWLSALLSGATATDGQRLRGGGASQSKEMAAKRWGARRRGVAPSTMAVVPPDSALDATAAAENASIVVPVDAVDAVSPVAPSNADERSMDTPELPGSIFAESTVGNVTTVPAPLYILYSIQTGPTSERLGRLNACLATWAADVGADDASKLQVVGVGAPLPAPMETATHAAAAKAAATATLQAAESLGGVLASGVKGTPTIVRWERAAACADTHAGGACKDAVALADGAESGASWVVLVGDDNYVVRTNLEAALSAMNPDEPHVLGIPGCGNDLCVAGGLCGGGGQIFSRGALRQMVGAPGAREMFLREHGTEANLSGSWGDVASCRVAATHNLSVEALPGLHGWPEDLLSVQADLCAQSPEAVKPLTFHYVSPEEMISLHRLVLLGPRVDAFYRKRRDLPHPQRETAETVQGYVARRERYVAEETVRRGRSLRDSD